MTPETAAAAIVQTTKEHVLAGLITKGEAVATVMDVKGCSKYTAWVLLGLVAPMPAMYGVVGD
jgi:hypothetical protein